MAMAQAINRILASMNQPALTMKPNRQRNPVANANFALFNFGRPLIDDVSSLGLQEAAFPSRFAVLE